MKISLKREKEIERELKELIKLKEIGIAYNKEKYKKLIEEYKMLKEKKNTFLQSLSKKGDKKYDIQY